MASFKHVQQMLEASFVLTYGYSQEGPLKVGPDDFVVEVIFRSMPSSTIARSPFEKSALFVFKTSAEAVADVESRRSELLAEGWIENDAAD
jgi:hypothetical protein